jgi:hypothetical protein
MDPLVAIFHNLERWRHLPSYQLERRADVFFSVYLKDIVEEHTGTPLLDELLPELPIKQGGSRRSDKVDYALFARDRSRVYLVELKTDEGSRRDEQDRYLRDAAAHGFRRIVEGIRELLLATNAYQKYFHLASTLERLGYFVFPPGLASFVYPAPRRGLHAELERIAVSPDNPTVEIIYVQPGRPRLAQPEPCIDFDQFAAHVSKRTDPLSQLFAEHLLKWRSTAGTQSPNV